MCIENAVPLDGAFEPFEPNGIVKYTPEKLEYLFAEIRKSSGTGGYSEAQKKRIIEQIEAEEKFRSDRYR